MFRRHRSRHHQRVLPFFASSYELVKETSEANPSTNVLPKAVTLSLLFLSWPIYLLFTLFSRCRPITTSHLFTFNSSKCVPFCGKSSVASSHLLFTPNHLFRSADPTRASNPDPVHGLVDPFTIFLVDRFYSVPVTVCISLQALFLKGLEARTLRFTMQSA
ncbi:unnamed protein product [Protopolystoma xenopodis]|uniref:Uncharacterized protein n=1 Tax=Protopolystoma xenopodis TaxID=117903 RepID=A0A448XG66_9PLAT|nr:unnamed protein product [Protopolystoma xenopodis]